jgi:hypothetical protein
VEAVGRTGDHPMGKIAAYSGGRGRGVIQGAIAAAIKQQRGACIALEALHTAQNDQVVAARIGRFGTALERADTTVKQR